MPGTAYTRLSKGSFFFFLAPNLRRLNVLAFFIDDIEGELDERLECLSCSELTGLAGSIGVT